MRPAGGIWRACLAGALLAGLAVAPAGGAEMRPRPRQDAAAARLQVVAHEDLAASPPSATLWVQQGSGPARELPPLPQSGVWSYWKLAGVATADLDGDGLTDIVAVVDYMTGIGPSGADPFPWAAVYLQHSDGFARDPAREALANEGALSDKWTGAAELATLLKGSAE